MTYYRRFRLRDLPVALSLDLREADKKECAAFTGLEPREAILASLEASEEAWVVIHDNEIEGVFGIGKDPFKGPHCPWFVATDKFSEFSITFAKESKDVVKYLLDSYGTLYNMVDSRNTASIKWLKWLGFQVDEHIPYYFYDPKVPFFFFSHQQKGG